MKRLIVGALCALSCASWGAVAYDSFNSDGTYNENGWAVGQTWGNSQYVGFQFVSAQTGMLDQISIALFTCTSYWGTPSELGFRLYSDAANSLGQVLAEHSSPGSLWPVSNDNYTVHDSPYTWTNPNQNPGTNPELVLQAGQAYWLVAIGEGPDGANFGGWAWKSSSESAPSVYSLDGGQHWAYVDQALSSFRVTVDETSVGAVPEPATIGLAGLALVAAARRRRKG